tara:strand:+ start:2021 stop:3073 length:1053 start_codon:yes stop_codon:yes gene_type:complete
MQTNIYKELHEDSDTMKSKEGQLDSEIFTKNILTNMTFSEYTLIKNLKNITYEKYFGYILQCDQSNSSFGNNDLMGWEWIPDMNIPNNFKENGWFVPSQYLTERQKLNKTSKKSDIKKYMQLDPIVKELQEYGAIYLLSENSYSQCHPDLIDSDSPLVHCDYQLNKKQITDMLRENKELKTIHFTYIRENCAMKGRIDHVNEKIYYKIVLFFILFLIMNFVHIFYIRDSYYNNSTNIVNPDFSSNLYNFKTIDNNIRNMNEVPYNNDNINLEDNFINLDSYDGYNKYIDLYNKLYNNNKQLSNEKLFELYNNIEVIDNIENLDKTQLSDMLDYYDTIALVYISEKNEKNN